MIEQVEEVSFVLQLEPLRDFEVFLHREIESVLERRAEKVPPVRSEARFQLVARGRGGAVSGCSTSDRRAELPFAPATAKEL